MIDWSRIDELQDEMGTEDFTDIAGLFLAEVAETLDSLDHTSDPAGLPDIYHGLKGSALNLGFTELAALCAAAEDNPADADPARIRASFAQSRAALDARFPQLAA